MSAAARERIGSIRLLEHGKRGRYEQGCRCDLCRRANTAYANGRAALARQTALELAGDHGPVRPGPCPGVLDKPCATGTRVRKDSIGGICSGCRAALVANPLVPATRVRKHLYALSHLGVGMRQVSAACDVTHVRLMHLRLGRATQLRANTEARILAVDKSCAADGGLVPAAPTHRAVERLVIEHGFTRTQIAARIGQRSGRLQLARERVTVRNAYKIARLLADADGDFL